MKLETARQVSRMLRETTLTPAFRGHWVDFNDKGMITSGCALTALLYEMGIKTVNDMRLEMRSMSHMEVAHYLSVRGLHMIPMEAKFIMSLFDAGFSFQHIAALVEEHLIGNEPHQTAEYENKVWTKTLEFIHSRHQQAQTVTQVYKAEGITTTTKLILV